MSRFGVDIGGTTIKIGRFDEHNNIIEKKILATKPERKFVDIARELAMTIIRMSGGKISEIGIGAPSAVNFSGSGEHTPWKSEITKYFPKVKISVRNDADCAAWAEYILGAGQGSGSMIMLTFGTGIGGGIIWKGKLFDAPCELGHMIVAPDGAPCTCGQKGCLEAYLNANAYNKSKNKDELHKILAGAIISLTRIFGINTFVLGGGLANLGDKLLNPIRKEVEKNIGEGKTAPKIHLAEIPDAGIIGAMLLSI